MLFRICHSYQFSVGTVNGCDLLYVFRLLFIKSGVRAINIPDSIFETLIFLLKHGQISVSRKLSSKPRTPPICVWLTRLVLLYVYE